MKDSEKQILLICQEECAEVTQAISKIFRFGFDSEHDGMTNYQRLTEEIGDLLCMINLLMEKNVIDEIQTQKASYNKRLKLEKWSNIFDDEKGVH